MTATTTLPADADAALLQLVSRHHQEIWDAGTLLEAAETMMSEVASGAPDKANVADAIRLVRMARVKAFAFVNDLSNHVI
jgi:hypothetical protein